MNFNDKITEYFRLTEIQKKALKKLQLETIGNLLYHFPTRYGDFSQVVRIENLEPKTKAVVYGQIKKINLRRTFRGHIPIAEATIADDTGSIRVIWFNQPYIAKMFKTGDLIKLEGDIGETKNGKLTINNPKTEKVKDINVGSSDSLFVNDDKDVNQKNFQNFLEPIYPESKGITSNWFYYTINKILKSDLLDKIDDSIPTEILKKYNLPTLRTALIWVHSPKKESDALSARKRFAFEEIFFIQIQKQLQRKETEALESYKIDTTSKQTAEFTNRFPFDLTQPQQKAVEAITKDLSIGHPMSRLLEGDVGSGKTAVAATAVFMVTKSKPKNQKFGNLQTAYMVPTEILAKQHFDNFIQYFKHTNIQVGLITSSGCQKFPSKINPTKPTKISRTQLLKWVSEGKIPILVGTHSLIQKKVKFKNLALVIIDEQHRFGIKQRKQLAQKDNFAPHLLSMTATPIPRTLALTIYGDLDLTLIDQMPLGRKPVITEIVLKNEREKTYEKIQKEISAGRQAYVICPRIDEPDPTKLTALNAKSVKVEAKRLQEKIFPKLKIGQIHGKMKPTEKDEVMKKFNAGEINILVSTSVIEVGVNVPNATVIVIEGAERFGLAQLHQLRGRVIRSTHQSYCYIFTESNNQKSLERLRALKTARNGFELSEYDLQLRGSGELIGNKQWGVTDLGMEAIKNIKMVEAARTEAKKIIEKDFALLKYPQIKERITNRELIHFE